MTNGENKQGNTKLFFIFIPVKAYSIADCNFIKTTFMKTLFSLITIIAILITGSCSKSGPSTPTPTPPNATAPVISVTNAVSAIATTSATSGGNISSDGGASVTARGVCWSTSSNPTITNNKTVDGTGTGAFISNLTGLTATTVYYVRAYATNNVGTSYGSEVSFTTGAAIGLPVLDATTPVTNITTTTGTSGGNITSDGGASVTARGVCWSTNANPTITDPKTVDGTGIGTFSSNLTGLTPGTVYYVRAYATNSIGTAYGIQFVFTTTASLNIPTLGPTTLVTGITNISAISGGNVISEGGIGLITRGVCWSVFSGPTVGGWSTNNGTGTGPFTSNITGLSPNTLYYVRSYATNPIGTGYGTEVSFTTTNTGSTTICSQIWMDRNLSVSTYRNGDPIPLVTNSSTWASLTTGAYCYYNNDPATEIVYGKLYNWYAINDPRGLAPTGWHVPSSAEWGVLETCLGGSSVAGGKLKETGTSHWSIPNTGATNSSGFTALPGGHRTDFGTFGDMGTTGRWWGSSQFSPTQGLGGAVWHNNTVFNAIGYSKGGGFNVRCVKD